MHAGYLSPLFTSSITNTDYTHPLHFDPPFSLTVRSSTVYYMMTIMKKVAGVCMYTPDASKYKVTHYGLLLDAVEFGFEKKPCSCRWKVEKTQPVNQTTGVGRGGGK